MVTILQQRGEERGKEGGARPVDPFPQVVGDRVGARG